MEQCKHCREGYVFANDLLFTNFAFAKSVRQSFTEILAWWFINLCVASELLG